MGPLKRLDNQTRGLASVRYNLLDNDRNSRLHSRYDIHFCYIPRQAQGVNQLKILKREQFLQQLVRLTRSTLFQAVKNS